MREVCECPYCGGHHPHISRIEGSVKLCWCQWCYHVHEVRLADQERGLPAPQTVGHGRAHLVAAE